MADKLLSLLDITKRDNCDEAIGLVEEITTVAPEFTQLLGRPINGTTYRIKKRTALPGGPIFRKLNNGVDRVASSYEQVLAECFFLDAQLAVDEAVLSAGKGEGNSPASILADEASGVVAQKMIALGDQFYRGKTAGADGFVGLQASYDATNCEVDATGSGGTCCSVWLIMNSLQGVHWIWGNNSGLNMKEWRVQTITGADSKPMTAMVNNLSGWVGLSVGHSKSIVRIKNVKNASGKYLTDILVAQALEKMPLSIRSQPGLRLLMNPRAALTLQLSRSTSNSTGTQKTDSGILQFAPMPTESNGVPIILTESLPNNE